MAQNAIVKHNVQRFLKGKSLNAIYDGYTYMPLLMGQTTATSFTHLYDYEPHWRNYLCPPHGVFGRLYFKYLQRNLVKIASKYTGFKKITDHHTGNSIQDTTKPKTTNIFKGKESL